MSKTNWEELEAEYVVSKLSYRELAKKHKISASLVSMQGKKNEWPKKRSVYRANVAQSAIHNARTQSIKNKTEALQTLISSADKMGELFEELLSEPQKLKPYVMRDSEGADYLTEDKIDTRALKDMTGAIKELAVATRELYDTLNPEDKNKKIIIELQGEAKEWSQ